MNNKRPELTSIKKAGKNVITNKIESKNPLLVRDVLTTPGNGLWCINTDKPRVSKTRDGRVTNLIEPATSTNPNMDLESEFDKKIIETLKFQVQDLSIKLQNAMSKCAEAEYRADRSENNKQAYLDLCEKKTYDFKELENKVDTLENTIINLNEALANTKKEIARLKNENAIEVENTKNYYEMYQNLMLEKERRESSSSHEMNNLISKLQFISSERDNLMKLLRTQDKTADYNNNVQKFNEEKEAVLKQNEAHLSKLINENADVKRKLVNEETNKNKLNEIIKKKKNKINLLKEELKSYRDAMGNYTNEVKWNQDLVAQRDNQIKVLKEKLKKHEEDLKRLRIENEKLGKRNNKENSGSVMNTEELVQLKAKPFLFGPEVGEP